MISAVVYSGELINKLAKFLIMQCSFRNIVDL